MRRGFEALASRPWASALVVALLPFSIGLGYLAVHGTPQPIVHDEFSNLLAADTFAHGRLTNPPHAFSRQFQNVNELVQPTYMSKYPPGQGLFLALGQILTGRPLIGAIICVALAAAAIYWMLLAFLPAGWALFGGLLAGTHPLLILWLTNYWGGGVALLGGALFLGAWKRLLESATARNGALLGVGLAVLANSRPMEGFLFSTPLLAWLAWKSRPRAAALAALLGVLVPVGAWMALYNFRVTGNPLTMPYMLYEKTYNPSPLFIWQSGLREVPDPGIPEIHDLWFGWNLDGYTRHRTPAGFCKAMAGKLWDFDEAWLEPLPIKVFLALPFFGLCGASLLWLGLAGAAASAVVFTLLFYFPHYSAPVGGLFFLLVIAGMRRAWAWRWRGRPLGALSVAVTAAWCLGRTVLFAGKKMESPHAAWSYFRAEALEKMESMGGRHLVLVRYGPGASYHDDWVTNGADIDGSQVVWAWSVSPDEDRKLEDYFAGRAVWTLDVIPPRPVFKPVSAEKARR